VLTGLLRAGLAALTLASVILGWACTERSSPKPIVQTPVSPTPTLTGTKRIVREGENFVLPDGTLVAADERGGFRLPNGEYVAALADGLLLANGAQCPADNAGGYVCP
jgi:hypothetical protein